jgi:hypothetical protein
MLFALFLDKVEYENQLAITSSPSQKYELKEKIKECSGEIERLKKIYE